MSCYLEQIYSILDPSGGQIMDTQKIGKFLKKLRNEKNMTQEELAEHMDVSNRTVSRWETGSNLPDIAILIELSDFYAVDLREILDGERKDQRMEKETEKTILKVAEYNQEESKQFFSRWRMLFTFGLIISVANLILQRIDVVEEGFWRNFAAFIQGLSDGGVTAVMIVGILYTTNRLRKIIEVKERLFTRL